MASATPASRSHESAATGSAGVSPAIQPAADITAITTRDDFLLELGQTLGGQAAVRPVDSLEGALESIAGGKRGQVLAIDAREVANVRAAVDAAHAAAPRAVVLVFAESAAEKQLGASLRGSNVFAVLPMPLDPRKTQAVVEGALAEAIAKHASAAPSANPLSTLRSELSVDTFEPQPAAVSESRRRRSKPPPLVKVLTKTPEVPLYSSTALWPTSSTKRSASAAGAKRTKATRLSSTGTRLYRMMAATSRIWYLGASIMAPSLSGLRENRRQPLTCLDLLERR